MKNPNTRIERKTDLEKLVRAMGNGFPKIITGIRRCGKSYLLKVLFKDYLLQNGVKEENIIVIDLDEVGNAAYRNPVELDRAIRKRCDPSVMNYVFIDELQLVKPIVNPLYTNGKYVFAKESDPGKITFVETILGLSREPFIDLYATGSNSKMLSSDIITEFRDKATNIPLGPFSFEEFAAFKGSSSSDVVFEFLRYGGMPPAVLKDGSEKREYLRGLFETTYFRDILEHNGLRKTALLDSLCDIVSEETGQLVSLGKIANVYQSVAKANIDEDTIRRYIGFFEDAFLLREARRFDIKGNKEVGALKKYYFVDNGLRNARLDFAYDDEGQMLENMVFKELRHAGFSVNVGLLPRVEKNARGESVFKSYEIDFIAKKDGRKFYVQVCSDLSKAESKAREIRPFLAARDAFPKILVVNRPLEERMDEHGFLVMGVADFLLKYLK